jgi:hypothetical protein
MIFLTLTLIIKHFVYVISQYVFTSPPLSLHNILFEGELFSEPANPETGLLKPIAITKPMVNGCFWHLAA